MHNKIRLGCIYKLYCAVFCKCMYSDTMVVYVHRKCIVFEAVCLDYFFGVGISSGKRSAWRADGNLTNLFEGLPPNAGRPNAEFEENSRLFFFGVKA